MRRINIAPIFVVLNNNQKSKKMKNQNYPVSFCCIGWSAPMWQLFSKSDAPVWRDRPFDNGRIDAVQFEDGTVLDTVGALIPGWTLEIGKPYGADPYNWVKS